MTAVLKPILIALRISGALLLLLLVVMSSVGPKKPVFQNPPHLMTPIIAFELAETSLEVSNILGSKEEKPGQEIRQEFQASINLDFLFLLIYAAFQILLALLLFRQSYMSKMALFLAIALALLASTADFFENLALLKLLLVSAVEYDAVIPGLKFFTMIKWQALGLISLLLAVAFYLAELKLATALFGLTFVTAVGGLFLRPFVELQTFVMGAAWAISWYKSLPLRKPWW